VRRQKWYQRVQISGAYGQPVTGGGDRKPMRMDLTLTFISTNMFPR